MRADDCPWADAPRPERHAWRHCDTAITALRSTGERRNASRAQKSGFGGWQETGTTAAYVNNTDDGNVPPIPALDRRGGCTRWRPARARPRGERAAHPAPSAGRLSPRIFAERRPASGIGCGRWHGHAGRSAGQPVSGGRAVVGGRLWRFRSWRRPPAADGQAFWHPTTRDGPPGTIQAPEEAPRPVASLAPA